MTDLISRSAAIADLVEWMDDDTGDEFDRGYDFAMKRAIRRLRSAPDVDAVPVVHARWIYSGDMDSDGNSQGYCSRCGAGDKHRADLKNLVPYCWKCGARMDGDANA